MASFNSTSDPLSLFRISIAQGLLPAISTSPSLKDAVKANDIGSAKYIIFVPPPNEPSAQAKPFPLNTQTRFISQDPSSAGPVDLRTIYHAWVNKDLTIPQFQASARELGEGKVKNLIFLERVDLFSWLEGQDSNFVQPAAGDVGAGGAMPSGPTPGGSGTVMDRVTGSGGRDIVIEPRLLEIYAQERPIGNRNTILRGEKPTDFSFVRSYAQQFVSGRTKLPNQSAVPSPAMPLTAPRKNRNREGIILLSPSASSLLQMANIKEFLENGIFKPVEAAGVSAPSMLKISRQLPNLSQTSPFRFNIVDSTTNFKPEYWQRVVAVFTTGQQWQFKSYMWSAPTDLFRHVKGFYVGWEGEKIPETVKNWGSGVTTLTLERQRRSRDKEVAEILWMDLERWMGEHGWSRD